MTSRQVQLRRGQRLGPSQPLDEIAVPNYPGDPSTPTRLTWWLVVAPVTGIVAMSFAYGVISKNLLYPVIISSVSMVYPMVMLLRQREQQKRWEGERDRVQHAYQTRIAEVEAQLERQREQQRGFLEWAFPEPAGLVEWAVQTSDRLWERRPEHSDFLHLRMGVGEVEANYPIKVPNVEIPELAPKILLEAREMAEGYRRVARAPLDFDLSKFGSLGISGTRSLREAALRAIVASASALHAPQDLSIFGVLPSKGISDWEWVKWLPHCQVVDGASPRVHLAYEPERISQLLAGLLDELEARSIRRANSSDRVAAEGPFILVVVVDDQAVLGEVALQRLMADGPSLRAGLIMLTNSAKDLPHGCRGRLEIKNEREATFFSGEGSRPRPAVPDLLTVTQVERLARALAPVQLAESATSAALPDEIRLLELLGVPDVDRLDLQGEWLAALGKPPTLRLPIGMRHGNRPLVIDLQQTGHGPHGLIAGTTGSGKSELLLSLLTSLAIANHPHQVNLVLVDYKGGTAMSVLEDLPHTVGVVTDLDGKQTRRALVAMRSELTRREEILARHQVADIDKYHELGIPEPFPYLFIVIDEFAELKEKFKYDLGEILNEFISIAQKGRALGVHLILAMQRPEGVVNESIRANMRFRICLRVERAEDSRNVLGRPDAYLLPSQPPGRAYFQVGKDEQFDLFQVARVAGFYAGGDGASESSERMVIQEVGPDGRRFPLLEIAPANESLPELKTTLRTEAQLLVEKAAKTAKQMGIERLPSPWPPPLPAALPLDDLFELSGQTAWDGSKWPEEATQPVAIRPVPVGLLDEPARQRQVPLQIDFNRSGSILVIGSPGSGRTTFLLTLCSSLARTHQPDSIHFHLVDFAGHQLRAALSNFPHVAGAYGPDNPEQIRRLLTTLTSELESRRSLFEKVGAVGLEGYRSQGGGENVPAILTVFNSFSSFQEAFADEVGGWVRLFREGGAYGLYFALTSDRFPSGKVSDLMQSRIALRITDRTMYSLILDARPDMSTFDPVPGRGFHGAKPPVEIQVALPTRASAKGQIQALKAMGSQMSGAWRGHRPQPVRILEEQVSLAEVLAGAADSAQDPSHQLRTWIGLDEERLRPVELDLDRIGSYFLICGPPESGKTTALATLALAFAAAHDPKAVKFALVTPNRGERYRLEPLARLPHSLGQATNSSSLDSLLSQLASEMQARTGAEVDQHSKFEHILLLVDDYHLLLGRVSTEVVDRLGELVSKAADAKVTTVLTLPSTLLSTLNDPIVRQAKSWRNGIWLRSTDSMESSLVGLRIPSQLRGKELPAGRGFLFDPAGQILIQLASPEFGIPANPSLPKSMTGWVHQIIEGSGPWRRGS